MVTAMKELIKRHWPLLRLRTILLGVLLFVVLLPVFGAVFFRLYENTLVRQTESELVAQGAALGALAHTLWPGSTPDTPPATREAPGYYNPEPPTIDLNSTLILAERPPPGPHGPLDPVAVSLAPQMAPVFERTSQTTLASIFLLDRSGREVIGHEVGASYAFLPEVRAALSGRPMTVLRHNDIYHPRYPLEWLSRAADVRIHHARPIVVGGRTVGVLLLSRSPRALFRDAYEDRLKFILLSAGIMLVLVFLAGIVSRGVTRPIEALSRTTRDVAAGRGGDVPETPRLAAQEIQQLYEDFRAMAEATARRGRYLRDFAAAVSHEFKTPMAGIAGAAEILDDHGEEMTPEERRRFLANIRADTGRLSQLTTRLLDLARADMAQAESGLSVGLAMPVQRVADGHAAPGFCVRNRLAAKVPEVAVPAATVEAVLTTLIENSRQAGAREVEIGSRVEDAQVVLQVKDDGPGIPPADRARLFEPFFTSRRAQGGTGLGLSIARSLLAAHNASVDLVSGESGACFAVRLPRA